MPPQNAESHEWAERLQNELPAYTVVLPETDEAVAENLPECRCCLRLGVAGTTTVSEKPTMVAEPRRRSLPGLLLSRAD